MIPLQFFVSYFIAFSWILFFATAIDPVDGVVRCIYACEIAKNTYSNYYKYTTVEA